MRAIDIHAYTLRIVYGYKCLGKQTRTRCAHTRRCVHAYVCMQVSIHVCNRVYLCRYRVVIDLYTSSHNMNRFVFIRTLARTYT